MPDPFWTVADLLERRRRLAALPPVAAAHDAATTLQARCALAQASALCHPAGRRARLLRLPGACEAFLCAADDLAAAAILRAERHADGAAPVPDLTPFLDRVGRRHDHVVGLLRRAGVRRTAMTP